MHGEIDETMLFNCAIPEEEIRAASAGRAATLAMAEDNRDCLMHWYRFNERDAADVIDEIGSSPDYLEQLDFRGSSPPEEEMARVRRSTVS